MVDEQSEGVPEEWLPVEGFERYSVSTAGRVWSSHSQRFMTAVDGLGYPTVALGDGSGKFATWRVHRLVARAFIGPVEGHVVRHLDDNKQNNHVSNLAIGTQGENIWDIVRNGNHVNANKTHCPRGHEYTPQNTMIQAGGRACRTCHKVHMARYKAKWSTEQHERERLRLQESYQKHKKSKGG